MKVESSADSYIGSVASGPQKPSTAPAAGSEAASARANAPAAGVTVTLSSTRQALAADGAGAEVSDARKVEAMKQAIANGSFQVNAHAIADKLLANAADMLGAPRH
jgi:negative regulator of flagellin synthesis FlgM